MIRRRLDSAGPGRQIDHHQRRWAYVGTAGSDREKKTVPLLSDSRGSDTQRGYPGEPLWILPRSSDNIKTIWSEYLFEYFDSSARHRAPVGLTCANGGVLLQG